MNSTTAPDQLFGCDVMTSDGSKIGSVDNVWVDDATSDLEFVGVKTGMIFGHTHIIPTAEAQIADGSITVPYSSDQIKNAPSYSADEALSPTQENEVYQYYGIQRETEDSPTGLADEGQNFGTDRGGQDFANDTGRGTTGFAATGNGDQAGITLSEEQLNVGKRQVEAGQVRLRKVVRTEHQEVPVELRREQVSIERVDAAGTDVPGNAFQDQEIEVPVMREEAVVGKEARVTGGVRLQKDVNTETRTVEGDVRSEDVEVDGADDASVVTDRSTTGYNRTDTNS